ncbi:MAG: pyridoxal-phosphate dependent enzyme, partial [Planctomycetes bacterium]|nr:pyridoxal-phosphate dependent enzyme [Planctomycetota bacterium]
DDATAALGVVTHSSGNHAAALARAARARGIPARVVMPHTAPAVKRRAVEGYGAEITFCEPVTEAREAACAEIASRTGAFVVPPFDHPWTIAGQGTVGLELHEQVADLDAIITPVGGGGLLSGVALAFERLAPGVEVFGAEAAAADTASRSLARGERVPAGNPTTVCDGLRTGLGELTFPIVRRLVERVFAVPEDEIVAAMRLTWERTKLVVEASSAVAIAAILAYPETFRGKRVGVVVTGGNVDLDALPW